MANREEFRAWLQSPTPRCISGPVRRSNRGKVSWWLVPFAGLAGALIALFVNSLT